MTFKAAQTSAVGPQIAPNYEHVSEVSMFCDIIGSAKPGYKRSPALIHQIDIINSNEGIDYYLIPANSSREPFGVVFQDIFIKVIFCNIRADAMGSGDCDAVAAIAQLLLRQQTNFPKANILAQLNKEYGFDIGVAVADLDRWSTQEAGGLSKIEYQSRVVATSCKELFTNPERAKELDGILAKVCAAIATRAGPASDTL
jgi:hypothetical protein